MNDAVQQIMNRAGCYACMPAAQLWALLVLGQTQIHVGPVNPQACLVFTCVDDGTVHEVCCVLDQGQYTLEITQATGGSNPVSGITFTASDLTNHILQLRLSQGFYTLDVVQAAGGVGPVGYVDLDCDDDSTRVLTVILENGFYTWKVSSACFTLTCVDDGTVHEVCCVLDQGQHTLQPTQSAGGSNPVSGITFTASDSTNHILQLRLSQGSYTLDVVQSAGGAGPVGYTSMFCRDDNYTTQLTVILSNGFYTWNLS